MRTLKGVAIVSLVLAALAGAVSGGDMDIMAAGSKQVVFGFTGWNLGSYEGGLGLRYYLRDALAVRAGLNFSFSEATEEVISTDDHPPYDYAYEEGFDDERRSVGLSVLIEKHRGDHHGVHLFYGGGLGYTYSWASSSLSMEGEDYFQETTYEVTTHWMNVVGLMGFEWYFADNISLGGEYNLKFRHYWLDRDEIHQESGHSRVYSRAEDGSSFQSGVGQLMVSIRF